MSIFFNIEATRDLLFHIESARHQLDNAHNQLRSQATTARRLLAATGTPVPAISSWSSPIEEVATGLANEHYELTTRLNQLITADTRTAYTLATTAGRALNPTTARTAIDSGWTYDETLDRAELELLNERPRPLTQQEAKRHRHLTELIAKTDAPFTTNGPTGDIDADLTTPRIGTPLRITAATATERGRELLVRAIADTANQDQILADEFEAYLHDNGNVTIVLPGVTDLSNPNWGYNDQHQSLRDLDQQALDSAANPGVTHNGYAQRVTEWTQLMIETGVIEPGAPTALIGHSFGGDTAFDLAQDQHFNGELVLVTHVFGAGYELTEPLSNVPPQTAAVAATNIYDAVAFTETYAHHGKVFATGRLRIEAIEEAVNITTGLANNSVEQFEANLDRTGLINVDLTTIPPLEIATDIYDPIEPNGLRITFEGGFDLAGFGHHQDEYQTFLADADNEHFNTFLDDLHHTGFTTNAVAVSVDVSRPPPHPPHPQPNNEQKKAEK